MCCLWDCRRQSYPLFVRRRHSQVFDPWSVITSCSIVCKQACAQVILFVFVFLCMFFFAFGPRVCPGQNALRFWKEISYDEVFRGLVLDPEASVGDNNGLPWWFCPLKFRFNVRIGHCMKMSTAVLLAFFLDFCWRKAIDLLPPSKRCLVWQHPN